ncbi:DUF2726 domain-containing protein [Arenicella sp. 4NH20-0111]|uniref:DUF2726 domain-containing protein n=1 Tax=Arenicella sp. 4NH20-0111 TaxID=3127648 RepID=UPI003104D08B
MSLSVVSQGWLIALLVILVASMFVYALFSAGGSAASRVAGMKKKSRLFSASERKFFETLSDALDYDYHIFAKVSVLEIVEPGPKLSKGRFKSLKNELEKERFDYVVCKKGDLSVAAVIELECFDKAVSRKRKQKRSALFSELCKATKLKLFYFDTRQDYLGVDIRRLITGSSKVTLTDQKQSGDDRGIRQANERVESPSLITEHVGQNSCPDCHSDLVTKVAVKGKHIGERFLMCRKYPYCEYRVLLKEPNVVNMRSVGTQTKEPKKGFSDWSG